MKRNLFVLFIFLLSCSTIIADPVLSKNLLVNARWGPEDDRFGIYLNFNSDNTYSFSFAGEGGTNNVKGNFKIVNNSLELVPTSGEMDDVFSSLEKKQTFYLITDNNSFYHSQCLHNDEWNFFNLTSAPAPGDKIVNGIPVEYIPLKKAKINTRAYIRKGPGTNFNYYLFSLNYSEPPVTNSPFLPVGYEIILLGKTKSIEQIGEMKGVWYFCDLNLDWYDSAYPNGDKSMYYGAGLTAWIFSPLVNE